MIAKKFLPWIVGFALVASGFADVPAQHVIVSHEPGRFLGMPANSAAWNWGDEILVGFGRSWFQEKADIHSPDRSRQPTQPGPGTSVTAAAWCAPMERL
jgi:hypothetical protein